MIVVIDTTTLASMAIALPGGTLAMILAAWRGGLFTVVVSDHVLGELRRTLSNTYFSCSGRGGVPDGLQSAR